jgi:hypothetical protein
LLAESTNTVMLDKLKHFHDFSQLLPIILLSKGAPWTLPGLTIWYARSEQDVPHAAMRSASLPALRWDCSVGPTTRLPWHTICKQSARRSRTRRRGRASRRPGSTPLSTSPKGRPRRHLLISVPARSVRQSQMGRRPARTVPAWLPPAIRTSPSAATHASARRMIHSTAVNAG